MKEEATLSPIQRTKESIRVEKANRKKRLEQAVNLLNYIVKIKLAPSNIHGVGVFAMRDINKGEKLYTDATPHVFDVPYKDFNKLRPEVSEFLLGKYPLVAKGSLFYYPDVRLACYLNHSNEANYDAKADKTTRRIKKGEEITENYKLIDGWQDVFPWLK